MTAAAVPSSFPEALRMLDVALDYLNGPFTGDLPASANGDALVALGRVSGKLSAAKAQILARFDACRGYTADGYGSAAAWLAARNRETGRAARAEVRRMRQHKAHPAVAAAQARGDISGSWAAEIAEWTRKLPAELRQCVDKLLIDTAAAGANLEDLAVVARAAYEKWRSQQPDPDEPDDCFDDRYLKLGTTIDNAGRVTGDLTPECATALQAVLEALGKKAGPEDNRTEPQRFHDALQLACELLLRAQMVPDRGGADTRADVVIGLSQLREMPGASAFEQAWLAALAGQPGYLAGKDAEAAACDAIITPVVTGHPDLRVVDQMIDTLLAFLAPGADHLPHADLDAAADEGTDTAGPAETSATGQAGPSATRLTGTEALAEGATEATGMAEGEGASGGSPNSGAAGRTAKATPPGAWRALFPQALSPAARQALRYAIARLAIDLVSGPTGIAAILRQSLLDAPYNSKSVILDVGYSDTIPGAIRRAVQFRAGHCEWPGCRKPLAHCDIHHLRHKRDGGPTSVTDCAALCQFHHDICIHRWNWRLVLHPDGTTSAYGPRGQVIHSHGPPGGNCPPEDGQSPASWPAWFRHTGTT
jgi:hypothetical protein